MNEMVNARSDDRSKACDAGREDSHSAELHLSPNAQLGTHATATAAEHPPINAATSDLSRCPFFRALTAATSAFAARPTNLMKTEATKPEATKAEARQTDAALQTARAIDSAPRSPSELH